MPCFRTPRRLALLALVALAPGGAPGASAQAPPAPAGGAASASLAPSWEVPVPDTAAPFVTGTDDGFVIATRAGRMAAHGAGGGPPAWQIDLEAPVAAPPVFASGRLVALVRASGQVDLLGIDASTGRAIFRQRAGTGDPFLSVADGRVVLADPSSAGPGLSLLDPSDGALLWKTSLPSSPSAPAAPCGDLLLVGASDGTVAALSAADGQIRWRKRVGGAVTTAPLCRGKRAWVGSADNRLHALKLKRRGCRLLWSYLAGGDIAGRILVFEERVLFFSYDTYLYALEADNGHLAWKVRLGRRPQPDSALVGNLLMVAPLNTERLEAFRLPDGAQAGALMLPGGKDRFVTPPVRAGRMIVIGAARYGEETARVIALDPLAAPGGQPAPVAAAAPPR